jgi:hypothetical protein
LERSNTIPFPKFSTCNEPPNFSSSNELPWFVSPVTNGDSYKISPLQQDSTCDKFPNSASPFELPWPVPPTTNGNPHRTSPTLREDVQQKQRSTNSHFSNSNLINIPESIRRRNVCNLISVNVSKPGPPSAKVIPKCLVLNARSLAKPDAASALCTEITMNKIDVCFISETWLNSRILSNLICPDGYILVRKDRSDERLGGAVAILCRNDWKINKLDFSNTVFECLWCEIHVKNNNIYYVAAIYNPPDPNPEPDLLDHLSESCEQILLSDPGARIYQSSKW